MTGLSIASPLHGWPEIGIDKVVGTVIGAFYVPAFHPHVSFPDKGFDKIFF